MCAATKIQVGSNVALPAAMLCLCMHLERISSVRQASNDLQSRRYRQAVDAVLCILVPIIFMALHYVVQGHRFDIVEQFGCRPTVYESIPAIFIFWLPPLLFSLGACTFAGLAFSHFWARRITFSLHLSTTSNPMLASRYLRLMAMAITEMFWGVLVTSLNMGFSLQDGLMPYTSWADVHWGFSQIGQFPTIIIPEATLRWTFGLWWTFPISSVIFFAFFAFGSEPMRGYVAVWNWVRTKVLHLPEKKRKLGSSKMGTNTNSSKTASMPKFVKPTPPALDTKVLDIQITQDREIYRTPISADAVTPSTAFTSITQFTSFSFEKRLPPLPFRTLEPVASYPSLRGDGEKDMDLEKQDSLADIRSMAGKFPMPERRRSEERLMEEGFVGSGRDRVIDISAAAASTRSLPNLTSRGTQTRNSDYFIEIPVRMAATATSTAPAVQEHRAEVVLPDNFSFSNYSTSTITAEGRRDDHDHFEYDLARQPSFPSSPLSPRTPYTPYTPHSASSPPAPPGLTPPPRAVLARETPQLRFQLDGDDLPETFNFEEYRSESEVGMGMAQSFPEDMGLSLRPASFAPTEAGSIAGRSVYAI